MKVARIPAGSDTGWVAYSFAVLRAVPHVHTGAFVPVGVLVHARAAGFIGLRAVADAERLASRVSDVDAARLARYLDACRATADGTGTRGVALAPPSERFHWLTAPRSDVIQSSPVHEGICRDPAAELDRLYALYVGD